MFFKKTIISCMLGMTILSTSLPVNIEKPDTEYTKQYEVKVTKIVIKVKYVDGVKYIRRWDASNNKWIDPEWKRVDWKENEWLWKLKS